MRTRAHLRRYFLALEPSAQRQKRQSWYGFLLRFNSQGIIFSPGAGKALAEWIVEGHPTMDLAEVDVSPRPLQPPDPALPLPEDAN